MWHLWWHQKVSRTLYSQYDMGFWIATESWEVVDISAYFSHQHNMPAVTRQQRNLELLAHLYCEHRIITCVP